MAILAEVRLRMIKTPTMTGDGKGKGLLEKEKGRVCWKRKGFVVSNLGKGFVCISNLVIRMEAIVMRHSMPQTLALDTSVG